MSSWCLFHNVFCATLIWNFYSEVLQDVSYPTTVRAIPGRGFPGRGLCRSAACGPKPRGQSSRPAEGSGFGDADTSAEHRHIDQCSFHAEGGEGAEGREDRSFPG